MNKLLELKRQKKGQNRKGEIWVVEKNLALLVKSHFFSIPSTPLAQKNTETGSQRKTSYYMAITLLQMTECNNYCVFREATAEKLRKGQETRERIHRGSTICSYHTCFYAGTGVKAVIVLSCATEVDQRRPDKCCFCARPNQLCRSSFLVSQLQKKRCMFLA